MTIEKAISTIIEVEKKSGIFIPVCWSKHDVELAFGKEISEEDWTNAKSLVNRHGGFSSQVLEAIAQALNDE